MPKDVFITGTCRKPIIILTDHDSPPDLMTSGAPTMTFVPPAIDDIESYLEELCTAIKGFLRI